MTNDNKGIIRMTNTQTTSIQLKDPTRAALLQVQAEITSTRATSADAAVAYLIEQYKKTKARKERRQAEKETK